MNATAVQCRPATEWQGRRNEPGCIAFRTGISLPPAPGGGAGPGLLVVLTKCDRAADPAALATQLAEVAPGVPVLPVTAHPAFHKAAAYLGLTVVATPAFAAGADVNTITAPMYVLTNTLGLIVALHISLDAAANLETVFLTFTYFATATRVMWEFNRIYRNLEGALTDAAQFADLLLDPVIGILRRNALHGGYLLTQILAGRLEQPQLIERQSGLRLPVGQVPHHFAQFEWHSPLHFLSQLPAAL